MASTRKFSTNLGSEDDLWVVAFPREIKVVRAIDSATCAPVKFVTVPEIVMVEVGVLVL